MEGHAEDALDCMKLVGRNARDGQRKAAGDRPRGCVVLVQALVDQSYDPVAAGGGGHDATVRHSGARMAWVLERLCTPTLGEDSRFCHGPRTSEDVRRPSTTETHWSVGPTLRRTVEGDGAMSGFGRDTTTDEVLEGMDLTGRRFVITGAASGLGRRAPGAGRPRCVRDFAGPEQGTSPGGGGRGWCHGARRRSGARGRRPR